MDNSKSQNKSRKLGKVKARVTTVRKKTIKRHKQENNDSIKRIELLETTVKTQAKQIDTLTTILMEQFMLKLGKLESHNVPQGSTKQLINEYAIKCLQGRSVKKPKELALVTHRLNSLEGDWVTMKRGPGGLKPTYK
jgi:hypothetical protein